MGSFGAVDYLIFIGTLAVSLFIGIYYAFFKKQTTNDELLVGGRSLGIFPIALSLLATYMSAILVLGENFWKYALSLFIKQKRICVCQDSQENCTQTDH